MNQSIQEFSGDRNRLVMVTFDITFQSSVSCELLPMNLKLFLFIILFTSIIGNRRVPFANVTVVNETSLRASKRNQAENKFEVEAKLNL